jgi:hypothetical protein
VGNALSPVLRSATDFYSINVMMIVTAMPRSPATLSVLARTDATPAGAMQPWRGVSAGVGRLPTQS